jgi:branched-chain amino acid aminotransferase
VRVWEGQSFRLEAHLDRFTVGLTRLRLDPGYGRDQIEAILHGCVRHAGLRQAYASMTCTRGRRAAGRRNLRTARPTFYCYAVSFAWISSPERQETGASVRLSDVAPGMPPRSAATSPADRPSPARKYTEPLWHGYC